MSNIDKNTKIQLEETQQEDETNERSPLNNKNGETNSKSSAEKLSTKNKSSALPDRVQRLITLIQGNERYRKLAKILAIILIILILLLLASVIYIVVTMDPLRDPNYRYLGMIPLNNEPKNTIRFSTGDYGNWLNLKHQMDSFLDYYNHSRFFRNDYMRGLRMDCNDVTIKSNYNMSCYFNVDEIISLCNKRDNYGYSEGSPCIFLKFNNIIGWIPDIVRDPFAVITMPPSILRLYNSGYTGPFVDCQPNTSVDREHLGGPIRYAPANQELPSRFFPYLNQNNYMTPFIAIKLDRPVRNVYIGLTCRLWAANLSGNPEGTWYRPSAVIPIHIYIE